MEKWKGIFWALEGELTDLLKDRLVEGPFEPQTVVAWSFPFFPGYTRINKKIIKIAKKNNYEIIVWEGGYDTPEKSETRVKFYKFNKPKTHPYRGVIAEN